jgi:hypothetical protein
MTVPSFHPSTYIKMACFASAVSEMGETIMDVGMISAIVNCALGKDWKYNLLLGGIGFVATIGFGICAKRAGNLYCVALNNMIANSEEAPIRIHAVVMRYRAT